MDPNDRLTKKEAGYFIKLTNFTDRKPRCCFLAVEYNNQDIIVGYKLIENLTEYAHHENISNQKFPVYYYNYFVYCLSVQKLIITYSFAEENGRHKSINLLSDNLMKLNS
jgi:hypothetical protein